MGKCPARGIPHFIDFWDAASGIVEGLCLFIKVRASSVYFRVAQSKDNVLRYKLC